MDKKIRAAAENYTPGYEDKAWQGMESLLEKHLPQKRKRRRIIFFLFFSVLVTGISAYFITREISSNSSSKPVAAVKPGITTQEKNKYNSNTNTGNTNTTSSGNEVKPGELAKPAVPVAPAPGNNNNASVSFTVKNSAVAGKKKTISANQHQTGQLQTNIVTAKKGQASQSTTVSNAPVAGTTDNPATIDNGPVKNDPPTGSGSISSKQEPVKELRQGSPEQTTDTTAVTTAAVEKPAKKDPSKPGFFSKFFISFSAGPDLSSVGTKPGQWRGQYGAGIGYAISDRWSVRTGFYVARKIYTADSTSYKTPFTSISGPYGPLALNEIKANCLVYEIPLSVVYSFAKNNKHNWFVSASISSYIMKSEQYDCTYKDSWGRWQTHTYSFKNENSHLFSVIGISGGYQYNFNKRLSLMAEPYLKMPVSGIGQGEVKLNSIGAVFTVGYKPFAKK